MTLRQRFVNKVRIGPIVYKKLGPCWVWTGAVSWKGYGRIFVDGVNEYAHRTAWFLLTGQWPVFHILHKCDNPPCVRPSHLRQGTALENMQDRDAKGRRNVHGEKNGRAILTVSKVLDIREKLKQGARVTQLSKTYGVARSTISEIKSGRNWSTV